MNASASWYNTGYKAVDAENERIARAYGPDRFWMKEKTEREIIFLDDEPITITEHSYRRDGKWGNFCTCLAGTHDNTPCCDKLGVKSRSFVGFYTVVDCTKYTDKKGKEHQFQLKLYPAKKDTLALLRLKKDKKGSFIGLKCEVTRTSEDEPNVGNVFEFGTEAVDMDKLFKLTSYKGKKLPDLYKEAEGKSDAMKRLLDTFQLEREGDKIAQQRIAPFNYFELLKPATPQEVRKMLSGAQAADDNSTPASGGFGGPKQDDDIPF